MRRLLQSVGVSLGLFVLTSATGTLPFCSAARLPFSESSSSKVVSDLRHAASRAGRGKWREREGNRRNRQGWNARASQLDLRARTRRSTMNGAPGRRTSLVRLPTFALSWRRCSRTATRANRTLGVGERDG